MKTTTQQAAEILIVEDSPTQLMALRFLLKERGYRVREAVNGQAGLDEVRRQKPSLIISDVMMPIMDGYEMCRTIKRDEALNDIPVLLLTTLSSVGDIIRGLDAGTDYYVTKPYDEDFLLAKTESLLASGIGPGDEEREQEMEVDFAGRRHVITAGRRQILNLLFSTYENAVLQNQKLLSAQEELHEAYDELNKSNSELLQLVIELEDRLADCREHSTEEDVGLDRERRLNDDR